MALRAGVANVVFCLRDRTVHEGIVRPPVGTPYCVTIGAVVGD
jgi:hypothetical protein